MRARFATSQVGPRYTATSAYETAKGADACGTLGNEETVIGRERKVYEAQGMLEALPGSGLVSKVATKHAIYILDLVRCSGKVPTTLDR